MTSKEELLEAIIRKAEGCGYKEPSHMDSSIRYGGTCEKYYYPIIFSHDFAKAFWGEEMCDPFGGILYEKCERGEAPEKWMIHLQRMVLQDDPILYLEQFLNDQ